MVWPPQTCGHTYPRPNFEHWKHGAWPCVVPPVHHAPLVARPSYPQVHHINTQCPFAPLIIAMYGTHAKMQNRSMLIMHAFTPGARLFRHGLQPWERFSCQGGMGLNQDTYVCKHTGKDRDTLIYMRSIKHPLKLFLQSIGRPGNPTL